MKYIFNKTIIAIFFLGAVAVIAGCRKDLLDNNPTDRISENSVWDDIKMTGFFLNGTYATLPSGFHRDWSMLDAGSDDAENSYGWPSVQGLNRSDYTTANAPLNNWASLYSSIRRTNLLIEKVDAVPGSEEQKKRIKGEATFLRGFFYFELAKQYGGVPLVLKSLSLTDELTTPRNTFLEVIDQVIADCDAAATILPKTYGGSDVGRATKGAALALKARALLYAASPLFNVKPYAQAAIAAKAVIDLGVYSLYPSYSDVFLIDNNLEVIFDKQFDPVLSNDYYSEAGSPVNFFNAPVGYAGGWGGTGPTQDFVDSYEMTDGKSIQASPLYNATNPYANKDSRFYASVLYEGAQWGGRAVETRIGGLDGMEKNGDATKTGYYMKKFLEPATDLYANAGKANWILFRYSEVLLNYAEAQNEAVGPDASVYSALNLIRARADQPDLPLGLTKDEMRLKIRNERRIELAFEEHRIWDIRRWKIAETVANGPAHGMRITGTPGNLTFSKIVFETRSFAEKNYLFPIPQSEIDKNKNLEQNPGY